jgi:hypothetical protein
MPKKTKNNLSDKEQSSSSLKEMIAELDRLKQEMKKTSKDLFDDKTQQDGK